MATQSYESSDNRKRTVLSSCHIRSFLAGTVMLDTVTIRISRPLTMPLPAGRKVTLRRGVKVWAGASGESLEKAEFSMPTLLHGHNGYVLENQQQVDAALESATAALAEISRVGSIRDCQAWRADIAWNFDLKAGPLILAHAALRLPRIHRGATLYDGGQGVSWRGARSRLVVRLYDKCRQMHVPGSVLRAEVSLQGEQLLRCLPGQDWHNFNRLWRVFRNVLVSIPPIQRPSIARNWAEAVGKEPIEIRMRILARLAHKPPRTFRRYNQQVEAAAANLEDSFSWADLLEQHGPPKPVHISKTRNDESRAGLIGANRNFQEPTITVAATVTSCNQTYGADEIDQRRERKEEK
jgi:hypothetical protein